MQILLETLLFLEYLGLRPDLHKTRIYSVLVYANAIFSCWYAITTFWLLMDNLSDVEIATETLSLLMTGSLTAFKILILNHKREKLIQLFNKIQINVSRCKLKKFMLHLIIAFNV